MTGHPVPLPASGDARGTVFLSYSRRDKHAVQPLVDALTSLGRKVWVDWADVPPTAQWNAEIEDAIAKSDAVIFAITPDFAASAECRQEIALADRLSKKLVPVLLRATPVGDLPAPLRAIQWIDLAEDASDGVLQESIRR